jgi:hypothetical protein
VDGHFLFPVGESVRAVIRASASPGFWGSWLYKSRYPRRRFARATASSACPAATPSSWISINSCLLVPILPQLRTRRTVPKRSCSIMSE